jgi:hypothetical protein
MIQAEMGGHPNWTDPPTNLSEMHAWYERAHGDWTAAKREPFLKVHQPGYAIRNGHVARMRINDPDRLAYRVLKHWDYGLIVSKIERHHHGKQCHNRHLHVWRWEYNMYKLIGVDWQDTAQDRDDYKDKVFFAKYQATKGAITFES